MFNFNVLIANLIIIVTTLLVGLVAYFKWSYQYWQRIGLPYLEPKIPWGSIPTGSESNKHMGVRIKEAYDIMKEKGWKHGGIYILFAPIYLMTDLEYIKNVMAKDFQYFTDRGVYHNEEDDPLSGHLFNIGGPKWRNLRTKMTPTFTTGKMKMMFQTLLDCEAGLQHKIETESLKSNAIDIKEVLGCFTTDIIGSCAFGLDCKTFEQDNSPFREYGKKVFEVNLPRRLKRIFLDNFPEISKKLHLGLVPNDVSNFFMKLVKDTVNYREKKQISRNDFMQLLINMKNNKLAEEDGYQHDGKTLTVEEIAAQCYVFFIAGFETSSTTMAFALYELGRNPDIQEKVRKEIQEVVARNNGKITYDSLQDMKYLGQVIDETLRMYPPGAVVPRKCVKNYKVPNTDIIIEKGITVLIPILAIHHDKEHYPNPEKFDPERFTEENKKTRHNYAHIPFGEGPRNCIGLRFGLMQTKVGLASLLRTFKFTVDSKTKEPLQMRASSIVLAADGEIWLKAEKLKEQL